MPFGCSDVIDRNPRFVVNYAAAIALEVRRPTNATSPLDLYVRLNFKNGTMNQDFVPYTMMGRPYGTYDIPYDEFVSTMRVCDEPYLEKVTKLIEFIHNSNIPFRALVNGATFAERQMLVDVTLSLAPNHTPGL